VRRDACGHVAGNPAVERVVGATREVDVPERSGQSGDEFSRCRRVLDDKSTSLRRTAGPCPFRRRKAPLSVAQNWLRKGHTSAGIHDELWPASVGEGV
jgi:hypothetical protein